MDTPAFATSFTGAALRAAHTSALTTPRCSMGDSVAPQILIKGKGSPRDSSISVDMVSIPSDLAAASAIAGNTALKATLRGRSMPPQPPAPTVCPPGTSPADFFFPTATRNTAPVITLASNHSLSVSYDVIETKVANVSSNAPDSVAFWKKKEYKWSPTPVIPSSKEGQNEILETAAFEKYFPSKSRNLAPSISIRKPAGPWDKTAYVIVDSEFVGFNPDLARQLSVKAGMDEPNIQASAVVENHFGGDRAGNKAPVITIIPGDSVSMRMDEIASTPGDVESILRKYGSG